MIALVTDSTAYLTRQEARDGGFTMVPMTYTVDDRIYHETYADINGDYEKLIQSGKSHRTSQPNMAAFLSAFEELVEKGYEVVCLTISSRLSGTYSSASLAAKQIDGEHIHIVDSLSAAGGMHILLRYAKKLVDSGLPAKEVAQELRTMRERIGIGFSVSDMGPLRRSGRLGVVRQSVGTILNVKPILSCVEGGVVSNGVARGRNEQLKRLMDMIPENAKDVIVHHIGNEEAAQRLARQLRQRFPHLPVPIRVAGPVLCIHLGVGVISAVWEEADAEDRGSSL